MTSSEDEDDIFAALDKQIAAIMAADENKRRAKELENCVKANRLSPAKKQQAVKELAELRASLEEAKWRPVAAELVINHTSCKCGCEYQAPDGLFIHRETIFRPLVNSRRRINNAILMEKYSNLPKRRIIIARQVEVCPACAPDKGWSDSSPSDVIIINRNETVTMSAQEFFGE
jgi:hypothetical protein